YLDGAFQREGDWRGGLTRWFLCCLLGTHRARAHQEECDVPKSGAPYHLHWITLSARFSRRRRNSTRSATNRSAAAVRLDWRADTRKKCPSNRTRGKLPPRSLRTPAHAGFLEKSIAPPRESPVLSRFRSLLRFR